MTTEVNNDTITVQVGNKKFTVKVTDVTELTDALLAARKEAYGNLRTARETVKAAAIAEKAEAKAAKLAAKRDALQAQLDAIATA